MVWRKLGLTDMTVTNLQGLTLIHGELKIRSDITALLAFPKQVLPQDVLTSVMIGKYAPGLVHINNCTNIAQSLINRLKDAPLQGRPLALPENIRLGWRGLPGTNTSLLRKSVNYGRKKFYNTVP
jgi:hypothetical protein